MMDDSVKLTHNKLLNYCYSHSNNNITYTWLYSNVFMANVETIATGTCLAMSGWFLHLIFRIISCIYYIKYICYCLG